MSSKSASFLGVREGENSGNEGKYKQAQATLLYAILSSLNMAHWVLHITRYPPGTFFKKYCRPIYKHVNGYNNVYQHKSLRVRVCNNYSKGLSVNRDFKNQNCAIKDAQRYVIETANFFLFLIFIFSYTISLVRLS